MEALKQIDNSKGFMATMEPSRMAFLPLLQDRRAVIESVKRETFQFGATERQSLDVYYPDSNVDAKPPILIFIYGGGLIIGDRNLDTPLDLVFRNCGAFFASRGILTVIPDYRLAPQAVYPEPVEDLRDAFRYVVKNLGGVGDTSRIFFTGHSAGGTLLLTLMLSDTPRFLQPDEVKQHIKGIAPRGTGYSCDMMPPPLDVVFHNFYGSQEKAKELSPLGRLKGASQETLDGLPPILVMHSEFEPPFAINPERDFIALFEERTGRKLEVNVSEGHNHFSAHLALSTGEGEQWGEDLAKWITAV